MDDNLQTSHILAELTVVGEKLRQPIKASSRLKYTSICVSANYIGLGSSTGAVYIFDKVSLRLLSHLPGEKEGAISHLSFAPNDNILAHANSEGCVVVTELNLTRRVGSRRLKLLTDQRGSTVTDVVWNAASTQMFLGDDRGRVLRVIISLNKAADILQAPNEFILRCEGGVVVQLCMYEHYLLVSTLTRAWLCHTNKREYYPIGKQERNGKFGACFYLAGDAVRILCARPKSRVWEATLQAQVVNTHQLKQRLATPSLPVVRFVNEPLQFATTDDVTNDGSAVNFYGFHNIGNGYVFTWSDEGIYVFDPRKSNSIIWSKLNYGVTHVCLYDTEIFYLDTEHKVTRLSLVSVDRLVLELYARDLYAQCAAVCARYAVFLARVGARSLAPKILLEHLHKKLADDASESIRDISIKLQELLAVIITNDKDDLEVLKITTVDDVFHEIVRANNAISLPSKVVSDDDSESTRRSSAPSTIASAAPRVQLKDCGDADVTRFDLTPPIARKLKPGAEHADGVSANPANCVLAVLEKLENGQSSSTSSSPCIARKKQTTSRSKRMAVVEFDEPVVGSKKNVKGNIVVYKEKSARQDCSTPTLFLDDTILLHGAGPIHRSVSAGDMTSTRFTQDDVVQASTTGGAVIVAPTATTSGVVVAPSAASGAAAVTPLGITRPLLTRGTVNGHTATAAASAWDHHHHDTVPVPFHTSGQPADPTLRMLKQVSNKVRSRSHNFLKNLKDKAVDTFRDNWALDPMNAYFYDEDFTAQSINARSVQTIEKHVVKSVTDNERELPSIVDLWPLKEATRATCAKLKHSAVLYDRQKLVEALEQWLPVLHATLRTMHEVAYLKRFEAEKAKFERLDQRSRVDDEETAVKESLNFSALVKELDFEYKNIVHVKDPFGLTENLRRQVSECLLMCLQSNVFADVSSYLLPTRYDQYRTSGSAVTGSDVQTSSVAECARTDEINSFRKSSAIDDDSLHRTQSSVEFVLSSDSDCSEHVLGSLHSEDNEKINGFRERGNTSSSENSSPDLDEHNTRSQFYVYLAPVIANEIISSSDDRHWTNEADLLIRCYFHLMEPTRIRHYIRHSHQSERFILWTSYINCLEHVARTEQLTSLTSKTRSLGPEATADMLSDLSDSKAELAHIDSLLGCGNVDAAVIACVSLYDRVVPLDVLYMIRRRALPSAVFLQYMSAFWRRHGGDGSCTVMSATCGDLEVREYWLEALLASACTAPDDIKCRCGMPRPFSHVHDWKERSLLDLVLSLNTDVATNSSVGITTTTTTTNNSTNKYGACLAVCGTGVSSAMVETLWRYGYWSGWLQYGRAFTSTDELLSVIVQLADMQCLHKQLQDKCFGSCDDWSMILRLKAKQSASLSSTNTAFESVNVGDGLCVRCSSALEGYVGSLNGAFDVPANRLMTWESLARCIVGHLGTKTSFALLEKVVPNGELSGSFYANCIKTSMQHLKQRALADGMLEKMAGYLWTNKPRYLSPKLLYLLREEEKAEKMCRSQSVQHLFQSAMEKPPVYNRYAEDAQCDWGVALDIKSRCGVCAVLLSESVCVGDQRVAVFACSHGYHLVCLAAHDYCPLCFQKAVKG